MKMKRFLPIFLTMTLIISCLPGEIGKKAGIVDEVKAENVLQNPRIETDESMEAGQKVTYDCVWFGSYPQTEIVDQASTCGTYGQVLEQDSDYEENSSLYTSLKNASGWDGYGDLTLNGTKYRRIKPSDATYYSSPIDGYYAWDSSDSYHYFRYEPIKWRVLNVTSTQLLLLTDICLDSQRYSTIDADLTWETSNIRSWLNGYGSSANIDAIDYSDRNFINSAFSSEEREAIDSTYLDNKTTSQYSESFGGNNTTDKVFFLSSYDMYNSDTSASYGFYRAYYSIYDEARRSKSSTFAKAMGAYSCTDVRYLGNCYWWLRSPGSVASGASNVNYRGDVHDGGDHANVSTYAVRPALNLNLSSSDLYSYAGTVSTYGTGKEEGDDEEENKHEAEAAAQAVIDQILALPEEITLENKEAIMKAIEDYNKLTPEQIAILDDATKQALEAAKVKLDAAQAKITEIEKAADDVVILIQNINVNDPASVKAARQAYDALTEEQKKLISADVLKLLTDAEKAIDDTEPTDQEAAQAATDAINKIDMDNPASIEAARKAYDALTPEQQKLVDDSIVQALINAEEEHKVDQAAADDVAEAIQNMDVSNPTSVFEAKKAFDKLTERQKRLIDPALVELLRKALKAASLIPVKIIKITAISNRIAAGKKVQLKANITPANASRKKMRWKSSNTKVAKVTQNGLVTIAKKAGGKSVRIATIATDGSRKQATFTIKVMKGAVTKVTVKGAKKTLKVGKTMKLKATVKVTKGKPVNKKIKWSSSKKKYATVSSNGVVKALKTGKGKKVKITAMATDGTGKKKTITIKIK